MTSSSFSPQSPYLPPLPNNILGISKSPALDKINAIVSNVEENIYRLPVEKGYGWDTNRTSVTPKGEEGNEYEIQWPHELAYKLYDGIVTHNHPRNSSFPWAFPSPSWLDLQFMHDHFLFEMRTVSKDLLKWHKKAHRVCHRRNNMFYSFNKDTFFKTVEDEFKIHHIPYTVDEYGVHAREFTVGALLCMDVAIQTIGRMWGFDYYAWTD